MKKKKFFNLLLKAYSKYGVLIAPEGTDSTFGQNGYPVQMPSEFNFVLTNGEYAPIMVSNVRAKFVSEQMKLLIEQYIPEDYPLEFIATDVKSELLGNRLYYLVHFTTVFDVIDLEHSRLFSPTNITIPVLCYEKVKDLDFFTTTARSEGMIVSDALMKEMKKKHFEVGFEFVEWKSI